MNIYRQKDLQETINWVLELLLKKEYEIGVMGPNERHGMWCCLRELSKELTKHYIVDNSSPSFCFQEKRKCNMILSTLAYSVWWGPEVSFMQSSCSVAQYLTCKKMWFTMPDDMMMHSMLVLILFPLFWIYEILQDSSICPCPLLKLCRRV